MNIEEIEKALDSRWENLVHDWNGQFITMAMPEDIGSRVGIDEEGRLCVLVDLTSDAEPSDYVQISHGLHIAVQPLSIDEIENLRFIVAVEPQSRVVFSAFIADFLLNIDGQNPRDTFEEIYQMWKKRWTGVRKPLGPRQEEGLFGEISVLMQLLHHTDDATNMVKSWVGPLDSLHDFESTSYDVEVKTTTREPPVVRVSKLEQLAPPDVGSLDLLVVQIEVTENGITLPDIVRHMLSHEKMQPHREALYERLEKVGYSDKHRLHYSRAFNAGHFTQCPIDGETPILPPELLADIPSTVSNIRYSLHINGLTRSSMTQESWAQMASRLSDVQPVTEQIETIQASSIESILEMPESRYLERKETVWFESKREGQKGYNPKRPGMVTEVLRAISGLLNQEGGTVLVGLHDEGEIVGLERDLKIAGNYDNLELWLTRDIEDAIGKDIAASLISLKLIDSSDKKICRIDVAASSNPVVTSMPNAKDSSRTEKFFIRQSNNTNSFSLSEAISIARRKWP